MSDPSPSPRRRRWPWLVLAALVVLVVAVVVIVPRVLDLERHRGRIEAALREATGWEPELGEMDFSVLRGLVLTVSPASLSAPDASSRFEIASLEVKADVLPLFRGRLQVRSIDLVRPAITIVRPSEARGWVLPPLGPAGGEGEEGAPSGEGESRISIDRVEVSDGTLRAEDRAASPPVSHGLEDVNAEVDLAGSSLRLSARLLEGRGRVSASGSLDGALEVEIDDVATEALAAVIGEGLIGEGGTISGRIDVRSPSEVGGRLTATNLLLLAGETPLPEAEIGFRVVSRSPWRLDDLEIRSGEVRVTGTGALLPAIDLDLQVHESPVDAAVRTARALFPLPLDFEPPGTARAGVKLKQNRAGELRYSASGEATAAGLALAEFLPKATDLATSFELSPEGELTVNLREGRVAGGPLKGTLRVDSVVPLGTAVFEGGIENAGLGQVLRGFLGEAAEKLSGPVGLDGQLRIDLGRETLDARALGGRLRLAAREVSVPGWDFDRALGSAVEEKIAELPDLVGELARRKLGDRARAEEGGAAVIRDVLDSLSAEADFSSLPWSLSDLRLAAGGLEASGQGSFDPLAGEVDVRASASLDAARTGALIRRYPTLDLFVGKDERLTFPLRIRGSVVAPEIDVDLKQLTRQKLGVEKKEAVKGLLDKLLD